MSYKTIQIHMDDSDLAEKRLALALKLASDVDTHLVGLHVIPPAYYPTYFAVEIPVQTIDQETAALQAVADRARERFEKVTANSGLRTEWRCAEQQFGDIAHLMTDLSRYADLNVMGQTDPSEDDLRGVEIAGTVLLGSGRPLLMVPYAGDFDSIGENVLVAWNASREATRAVFEAVPILQAAKQVQILAADTDGTPEAGDPLPGTDIATALARHDVQAEIHYSGASEISIGDTLLNYASDLGVDLLVMGAYGHSRLRETIFGGATREVLEHMTVPVFMSH